MLLYSTCSTLFPYTTLFRSIRRRQGSLGFAQGRQPRHHAARCLHGRIEFISPIGHLLGSGTAELAAADGRAIGSSEEHTSELQSRQYLVCRLLLEKKNIHLA